LIPFLADEDESHHKGSEQESLGGRRACVLWRRRARREMHPGAKLSTQFGFSGGKMKRKGERKEPN
jgi:hypothetical protein